MLVMMSPPCTMFSTLQHLWNFGKMKNAVYQTRMAEAKGHIAYCMHVARLQQNTDRFFGFEQPGRASSWDLECVKSVAATPGVVKVAFDMCMFGKTSPRSKIPMKKRTIAMTNRIMLAAALANKCCDGSHAHIVRSGSERGAKLSTRCQVYSPQLCEAIVRAALSAQR